MKKSTLSVLWGKIGSVLWNYGRATDYWLFLPYPQPSLSPSSGPVDVIPALIEGLLANEDRGNKILHRA